MFFKILVGKICKKVIESKFLMGNIKLGFGIFSSFIFLLPKKRGGQCACRHNNELNRSGLDPLSATNLCYVIILLLQLYICILMLSKYKKHEI